MTRTRPFSSPYHRWLCVERLLALALLDLSRVVGDIAHAHSLLVMAHSPATIPA